MFRFLNAKASVRRIRGNQRGLRTSLQQARQIAETFFDARRFWKESSARR